MIYLNRVKRFIFVVPVVIFLCTAFVFPPHSLAVETQKANYINIVFDDSGSMYHDDSSVLDRWCNASYALSVFANMLDEGDMLNIFPMGLEGDKGAVITGSMSPQDRQNTIEGLELKASNTYFSSVEGAYADIKTVSDSYDRWLVILTDGEFNRVSSRSVQNHLEQYADEEGIKIVFLAIGSGARPISADEARRIYSYEAQDSYSILPKVTDIANRIFENYQFDERFIKKEQGRIRLIFETPVEMVTIFAQGKDIVIGDLKSADKNIPSEKQSYINVTEKSIPQEGLNASEREQLINMLNAQTNLSGCIATFASQSSLIPAGEYTLELSDTSNVEVYARPVVDIAARFFVGGREVQSNTDLIEGEYRYEIYFVDPITGQEIESELLSDTYATIKTDISVNGQTQQGGAEGTVLVDQGELRINATAVLPSGKVISTNNELVFTVSLMQPPEIEIVLEPEGEALSVDGALIEGQYSYRLILTDAMFGGEPGAEVLDKVNIDVLISSNGEDIAGYAQGGSIFVERGTLSISANAVMHNGEQSQSPLYSYEVVQLLGEINITFAGEGSMELEDLEDCVLYAQGDINGEPLTSEQWENTVVSVSGSNNIEWEVRKGSEVSTWELVPHYKDADVLATDSGETIIEMNAALDYDYQSTQQTAKTKVDIVPLSFFKRAGEWLKRNYWWLLIILLVAFLAVAYLTKKRFKRVVFKKYGRDMLGVIPNKSLKFQIDQLSKIMPFAPEKGFIRGEATIKQRRHRFSIAVVADSDRMRIKAFPSFDREDRLAVGSTNFRYRMRKNKLVREPDMDERQYYLRYTESIVLYSSGNKASWRSSN